MASSRRSVLRAGLAGAAGLALAGCAGQTDPLAGKSTAVPTQPTTINWWVSRLPSHDGDLRPHLINAFRRRYPQIDVQIVRSPQDTNANRAALTAQILGGSSSPDVYEGDITWAAQFGHASLAMPLREVLPAGYWDAFPPALRSAASYGDELYFLPMYTDQGFLLYRKDLLAKHGLRVPGTWEELVRTSGRLIEAGEVRSGFAWQGASYEGLTADVTEFLADAGGAIVADGSAAFGSPASLRAIEFLHSLVTRGISPAAVSTYQEQDSMQAFLNGDVAFLRNWAYAYGSANEEGSGVAGRVGLSTRPGFDGMPQQANATLGGAGTYLNPHTRNLGAALAFARFIASPEGQRIFATKSDLLPAALGDTDTPSRTLEVASRATLIARPSSTPYYPQVSKAVYTNVNAVIAGARGVPDALGNAVEQIDDALAGAGI
jgi:multiple sugar transport system substrate-binding protein